METKEQVMSEATEKPKRTRRARRVSSPSAVFKPYIVRRPSGDGGCQVVFPLTKLDELLNEALELALNQMARREAIRLAEARQQKGAPA